METDWHPQIDKYGKAYGGIPRVMYFFWSNHPMSYLHYLTLKTFRSLNPDWVMILYKGGWSSESLELDVTEPSWETDEQKINYEGFDWREEALKKVDISVPIFPISIKKLLWHAVHTADYLKYLLLACDGGFWSDMDIYWLKPISALPISDKAEVVFSFDGRECTVEFMGAIPKTPLFKKLKEEAEAAYDPASYECMGKKLLRRLFQNFPTLQRRYSKYKIEGLPSACLRPYHPRDIGKLFKQGNAKKVTGETVGIHWYGGAPAAREALNKINPDNLGVFKRWV